MNKNESKCRMNITTDSFIFKIAIQLVSYLVFGIKHDSIYNDLIYSMIHIVQSINACNINQLSLTPSRPCLFNKIKLEI